MKPNLVNIDWTFSQSAVVEISQINYGESLTPDFLASSSVNFAFYGNIVARWHRTADRAKIKVKK